MEENKKGEQAGLDQAANSPVTGEAELNDAELDSVSGGAFGDEMRKMQQLMQALEQTQRQMNEALKNIARNS